MNVYLNDLISIHDSIDLMNELYLIKLELNDLYL